VIVTAADADFDGSATDVALTVTAKHELDGRLSTARIGTDK